MSTTLAGCAGEASAMSSLTEGMVTGQYLSARKIDIPTNHKVAPLVGVSIRAYNFSQFDFPGSESCCTAVAVVAAEAFLRANGVAMRAFGRDEDVFEIISMGIVWHSRWLSADASTRSPSKEFGEGQLFATADEVCALPGMTATVTDQCFGGALVGSDQSFGMSLAHAIEFMFKQNPDGIEAYVLTTKGYSTMIGRVGERAFVFDSHKRSAVNGLATDTGRAVLVSCRDKNALVRYLLLLYLARHKNGLYTIQQVGLASPPVSSTPTVDLSASAPELSHSSSSSSESRPAGSLSSESTYVVYTAAEERQPKRREWFSRPRMPTLEISVPELDFRKWLVS